VYLVLPTHDFELNILTGQLNMLPFIISQVITSTQDGERKDFETHRSVIGSLRDSDLSDANIRCANLSDAEIRSSDLSGANLLMADLSGACLEETDLSDAYLGATDMKGGVHSGADLSGANLVNANLSGAVLLVLPPYLSVSSAPASCS